MSTPRRSPEPSAVSPEHPEPRETRHDRRFHRPGTVTERVRIPRDPCNDYTEEMAAAPPRFRRASRPAPSWRTSGTYSFDPGVLPRQHRELHRRRAGADRPRRTAAHRRRARPGRLLRSAGHDRGHAGRQLQPRHAAADRVRRRQDRRSSSDYMQRAPVFVFDDALAGPRLRRLGRRALRRDQGGGRGDHPRRASSSTSASTRSARCATCASTTPPATPPGRT